MDDDRMSVSSGSSETYEPFDPSEAAESGPSPLKRPPEDEPATAYDKRVRLDGNGADLHTSSKAEDLPPEIWQYIFSHLTPPTLGLLMTVSKGFASCLDGSVPAQHKTVQGRLQTVDAEAVWASWRIAHQAEAANMPHPLEGCSERDMWRLVRGIRCDGCDKLDDQPRKPTSPDVWRGGPTMSTTRAIWPFALRLCGECLYRFCEKDTTLLCTPAKQFRPALPYAFLTHDFNYVPTTILKEAGQAPSGLHISKQFYKGHVERISQEWEHTLSFGQAAAEEWLKGLDGVGNGTTLDAARWEHWETKGGFNRALFAFTQLQPAPLVHPTPTPGWAPNMLGWPSHSVPPPHQQFAQAPGGPPQTFPQHPSAPAVNTPFSQPQFSPQAPMQSPFAQAPPPGAAGLNQQQRMERNPRDATEAKAARRQEIEQRSLTDIQPLLPPNVLRHMSAFQAAIQIGIPLNDAAWEALKPKLLEQREAAERVEREHTAQLLALQTQVETQGRRQTYSKEKGDAQDKEWKEALWPIKERLSGFADDFISQHWKGGQSVNSGNVARFAMAVFDHVRKTFYNEVETAERIAAATGQPLPSDPPDGPFQRKLTLEIMKWVYDNKIRTHSRDYGKEIFFCNSPGCQMKNKLFAFEGVIQHIGARHTHHFSKGNVVVHWQTAEWPEELPFFDPGSGPMPSSHHGNGGYSRGTTTSPQGLGGFPPGGPPTAASPFGAPHFGGPGSASFTPPVGNGYPPYVPGVPQHGYGAGGVGPGSVATKQSSAAHSFDPTDLSQFFKSGGTGMPSPTLSTPAAEKGSTDQLNAVLSAMSAKAAQSAPGSVPAPPTAAQDDEKPGIFDSDIPDFEVYQEQLKFVADTARSAWSSTNAIHGLPTSVRVFAVIQYTVLKFLLRFDSQLSIGTFTAALMNSPILEPLKQADDLLCCQCHASGPDSQFQNPMTGTTSLVNLLSHFQSTHSDISGNGGAHARGGSWVGAMIAISAPEAISELVKAPGMTDEKLAILAEAFPEHLPQRMPRTKDSKDHSNHRSGKKYKHGGRRVSSGRRGDLEDPNLADSEGSGKNGFRSSHSPGEIFDGRRRSSDDEQYDPSKPALSHEAGMHKKRREHGRKTSGFGADLAKLVAAAEEQSNQAAAEENRRRGIVSDAQPEHYPESAAVGPHHSRATRTGSRPNSAHRAPPVFVSRQDHGDRHTSYGNYPEAQPRYDHSEQGGPRHVHMVRDGQPGYHAVGTPPSAGRNSRHARYDEPHERLHRERTRSRSPLRYDDQTSPERAYQTRQREYVAADRPPAPYQYQDEPEPIYIDQYGRRVRLVRIDDSAPPPPGYVVPRRSPGEIDYVDHRPPHDPRYYDVPPDPRYDPRYNPPSASYASQPMPGSDNRYVD